MPSRYRADLVDVAWAKEHAYGVVPPITALSSLVTAGGTSTVGQLRGTWGLVTGGVDHGIGVMNRNMLFPIQGRERLEGAVSQTLLCHDSSRLWLEQCFGLIFNAKNAYRASLDNVNNYTPDTGVGAVTATTFTVTSAVFSVYTPDDGNTAPTHIVIVGDVLNEPPNRTQDTWAYIGQQFGTAAGFYVWKNEALTEAGWNGIRPPSGADTNYSIHGIGQETSATPAVTVDANSNNVKYVTRDANINKHIFVRPTLVQPSFTLGARFRADDGSEFITNYSGCKISRCTFNFEEGNPVNFGSNFIARDFSHNIGQHDGTGAAEETMKYKAEAVAGTAAPAATNTVGPNYMKNIRVIEQPYFYSTVELTFHGVPIARFRRFTITVDNALDPRYYVTQGEATGTRDNRQILHEILEGRRNISFGGSLDLDDDGGTAYPAGTGSTTPTDAIFLRYLLNQGMTSTDIRDQNTLKGIGITIELRKINSFDNAAYAHDKIKFHIGPTNNVTNEQQIVGNESDVSMVIRSAPLNIPAPPSVHIPMDIEGMASSMFIEIMDGVASTD